ncbi:MAG: Bug family tripartite tricarboxylate transporter substrate binding protein [Lautropia sp.]
MRRTDERRRYFGSMALGAALSATMSTPTSATAFPSRPIRLIVPYAPGGLIDTMARLLQRPLASLLEQPVVVENKPGAGGSIGTMELVNAPADGHTLLFVNNGSNVILPLVQKVPYDPLTAFATVSLVASAPTILITREKVPGDSIEEVFRFARAQPKGVSFSSSGGTTDLLAELFGVAGKARVVRVRYGGQAPATMAVLSGEVDMSFAAISDQIMQSIKSGRIKGIGVTAMQETPLAPGIAPLGKALPNLDFDSWYGIVAPAGTPPATVAILNKAVVAALETPELRKAFVTAYVTPAPSTPDFLASKMRKETEMWERFIRDNNIRLDQ